MPITKAIVINRFDYKENDNLICFYTLDFGKLLLSSRGTKKASSKLVAHLEPFNFVELMMIKTKAGLSVGSVVSKNSFLNLKSNYNSIYLAGSFFNFFNKLVRDEQQDFELFFFLNDFLKAVNDEYETIDKLSADHLDFLVDIFKSKFLSPLGYLLNIESCSFCKTKENLEYLDFEQGGLVCKSCSKKNPCNNRVEIDSDILKEERYIENSDFASILKIEYNDKLHKLIKKKILYFTN
jgi:DNA repair protein RecO (recombination protein O)